MSVAKILTVAEAEFRAMVRSKAFLVSIVFLPILILGMSFLQKQISARADTSTRRFAVIDASGRFYDGIAEATRTRDSAAAAMAKSKTLEPRYEPERVDMGGRTLEQVRLELSDRVRKEQLFAFVEIPAEPDRDKLRYYSDHPASRAARSGPGSAPAGATLRDRKKPPLPRARRTCPGRRTPV